MRRLLFIFLCLSVFALAQQKNPADELPKLQHLSADQVNPQIDPCTDFYQYACSKFFAANPIPPDQAGWGVAGPLLKWNETVMRQALEAAAAKKQGRTVVEQKIGDYWSSCMDESKVETASAKAFQLELKRIDELKQKPQLVDELAHQHATIGNAWLVDDNATFAPMFGFSAIQDYDDAQKTVAQFDQGGFALPGRDFYLNDDAKSLEVRKQYLAHITNMLKLTGEPASQAAADAAVVLQMETELAKSAMDVVKRRDPKNINNKMTLVQIQKLSPSFDWQRYLTLIHAPAQQTFLVTSPDFFRGLEQAIQQHPIAHWKVYLKWQLAHQSAQYLGKDFVNENFNFFSHTLAGTPELAPRWRRCVHSADNALGDAVGQAYVSRAFPPQSKERVLRIVKAIEGALDQDISQLTWMTDATKKQASAKLHAILDKVGYPDKWRDYSALEIKPDAYLENVHRATAFEFNRWLQKIGKPIDRYDWTMTPPTINAYYDPQFNTINFPAGILQPPFFSSDADDATNFGAEGSVIGHEITHGFDDQGRKFDERGNLHDWWTAEDAKNYDERGKCISDEYTQEILEAGVKQNGLLTQGEDTADNGGLYLALIGLENSLKQQGKTLETKGGDGLTEVQRFFLSFANNWCEELRPEIMRTVVLTNPHSLPKYRVNNTIANMPEFARAFGCAKGKPLVHENACRVW
ncbi:MAG TPA: M13 family metallopeptidase [Candidatus Angelobacter sp.]|jgi:endothelin-converting enzyme/putative endopeptidase|nr:M13 family metallopeptidase [Candidatus Angelobacter sp.]